MKKHLVVVRVGMDAPRIEERIKWIDQQLIPKDLFPNRVLALFGEFGTTTSIIKSLPDPYGWVYFNNWEDLYNRIMTGGFFESLELNIFFRGSVYINLIRNQDHAHGWGIREIREYRCILRALMLQSKGNTIFFTWGLPQYGNFSKVDMKNKFVLSQYLHGPKLFEAVQQGLYANQPFVLLLDHYLLPIDANDSIPDKYVETVKLAMEKKYFTKEQTNHAKNVANHQLFFVEDYVQVHYHRSKNFPSLQKYLVFKYVDFKYWYETLKLATSTSNKSEIKTPISEQNREFSVDELKLIFQERELLFINARNNFQNREELAQVIINIIIILTAFILSLPFPFAFADTIKVFFLVYIIPFGFYLLERNHKSETLNYVANEVRAYSSHLKYLNPTSISNQDIINLNIAVYALDTIWEDIFGKHSQLSKNRINRDLKKNKDMFPFSISRRICDCCRYRGRFIFSQNPNEKAVITSLNSEIASQGHMFKEIAEKYRRCTLFYMILALFLSGVSFGATYWTYYEDMDELEFRRKLITSSVLPFTSFFWCFYHAGWRWYFYSSMMTENAKLKAEVAFALPLLTEETLPDFVQTKQVRVKQIYEECNDRWAKHHRVENKILTNALSSLKKKW